MRAHVPILSVCLIVTTTVCTVGMAPEDLQRGFQQVPPDAAPWVYWFWLDGNISREGITADLEAMKRAGIGGVLIMEVDQGAPAGPIRFGSPAWRETFAYMLSEANRLGIQVNMNNDAGWTGSGGPWIKPEQAMQRLVWSELTVEGPTSEKLVLPQPPVHENYYRDVPASGGACPNRGHRHEVAGPADECDTHPACRNLGTVPR